MLLFFYAGRDCRKLTRLFQPSIILFMPLSIFFIIILGLLSSCSYQSSVAIKSIVDEDEDSLISELFAPNSPAQQNINLNTTMPVMPHTVKEMQYASGMKP